MTRAHDKSDSILNELPFLTAYIAARAWHRNARRPSLTPLNSGVRGVLEAALPKLIEEAENDCIAQGYLENVSKFLHLHTFGKPPEKLFKTTEPKMDLKPDDMLKLEKAFFQNLRRDNCEYGAIGVDPKRPFGNSDVEGDILELIGATPEGDDGEEACWSSKQRAYAAAMYDGLIEWLQTKYGA